MEHMLPVYTRLYFPTLLPSCLEPSPVQKLHSLKCHPHADIIYLYVITPDIDAQTEFQRVCKMAEMTGAGGQYPDFPAVATHGGKYIKYNIFENSFEITAKYRPPVMPIGRGAYGIVWYVFLVDWKSTVLFVSISQILRFLLRINSLLFQILLQIFRLNCV